jgi:hypothetical protein
VTLRRILDDRWRALDARRPETGLTTSALEMQTRHGPLLIAVDRAGGRHLLVPLGARQSIDPDRRSRAVHLTLRPLEDADTYRTYADLALMESSLTEVFTSLCEDVLIAVERDPSRAVRGVRVVLSAWRSLLVGAGDPLGPEALVGLFGELIVLTQLAAIDSGIASCWHGPTGSAQDFHRGANALEIKTTVAPEGRQVRVHGVDQLEPVGGTLLLVWLRLRRDSQNGRSVPDLVDEAMRTVDDPAPVRSGLAALRYSEADRTHYADIRFTVAETASFLVGPGFPRITPAGLVGDALGAGLSDVVYTLDLDSGPARAARTDDYVGHFLGEHS